VFECVDARARECACPLPSHILKLQNDTPKFKAALENISLLNTFYSLDDFFPAVKTLCSAVTKTVESIVLIIIVMILMTSVIDGNNNSSRK
jgi:hypothetical protein